MNARTAHFLERGAAIVAAVIFLQTLYFKFTAHPDSVYIFTKIGGEPALRIGSGIAELIIAILLIYPRTTLYGAIAGFLLMIGAIGQHLFVLGIVVNNDGGTLFILALITFFSCGLVLYLKRAQLRKLYKKA
jgi:putative oxidoreductase